MEEGRTVEIDWTVSKAGAEAAFEDMVAAHQEDVTQLAYRLLGWSGEVDDVVQEVFLAAYLHRSRFRGDCSPRTWLFTITLNTCRSFQRRQALRRRLSVRLEAELPPEPASPPGHQDEHLDRIRRALLRLPPKYREPVVLRYLQEMEIEQISDILKISANAVHVRLNRARARLREVMTNE